MFALICRSTSATVISKGIPMVERYFSTCLPLLVYDSFGAAGLDVVVAVEVPLEPAQACNIKPIEATQITLFKSNIGKWSLVSEIN
jgi:hypothetical protein